MLFFITIVKSGVKMQVVCIITCANDMPLFHRHQLVDKPFKKTDNGKNLLGPILKKRPASFGSFIATCFLDKGNIPTPQCKHMAHAKNFSN